AAINYWYTPGDPNPDYLHEQDVSGNLLHVLNNDDGIVTDINTTTSGDYCNVYKAGSPVIYQNGYDWDSVTGFTPYTPGADLNDWQEGDAGSDNICQARQGT